jgi:hypothetical protein
MRDAANTETSPGNEQLVTPESVEPAQSPVPTVMPRVVIVGSGFGGLNAARALRNAPVHLWVVLHLMFLIGFRNRLAVGFQWLVYFTTFQGGARLITFQDTSSPM